MLSPSLNEISVLARKIMNYADGPDEVHKMVIARRELNRAAKRAEAGSEAAAPEPAKAQRRSFRGLVDQRVRADRRV